VTALTFAFLHTGENLLRVVLPRGIAGNRED
jgi:hypothetical protein